MSREYMIKCTFPTGYNASTVLRKLPSPISRQMTEIYNYSVKSEGFYSVDHLVDSQVAAYAFKLFVDEVLQQSDDVTISKL